MEVKRGEIYSVDMIERDTRGQEIGKKRPGLVVQADPWNQILPTTIIVPLTSHIPSYTSLGTVVVEKVTSGLREDSTILVDQIRSVGKSRLEKKIGNLPDTKMQEIDRALSLTLGLIPLD